MFLTVCHQPIYFAKSRCNNASLIKGSVDDLSAGIRSCLLLYRSPGTLGLINGAVITISSRITMFLKKVCFKKNSSRCHLYFERWEKAFLDLKSNLIIIKAEKKETSIKDIVIEFL